MDKEKIINAGKIASEVKKFAREIVEKNKLLIEIAEKIEDKIFELGGKPAFPVNLSIDNVAAHFTPSYNGCETAHGLIKVDLGVHVDGWVADTAFSMDLENSEENRELISASEKALESASGKIKKGISISEIGGVIQHAIEDLGFSPIINLSGHEIKQHELHAGLTVPNIDNNSKTKIDEGLFAVEPFASTGQGRVHDGKPSGIYILQDTKLARSPSANKILKFIEEEYQTLPFCSRWIYKKFKAEGLIALRNLEANGNLHQFPQLVEEKNAKVSQAENTFLVEAKKVMATTD